jgi:hypothetical protein
VLPRLIASFVLIVLCALGASGSLSAQDTVIVKPGDRIRISSRSDAETPPASVVRVQQDSVFLRRCSHCSVEAFQQASATRVEVSLGHRSHRGLGAAVGFVGGAAIGAFVLAPCPHGNSGADGPPCGAGQAMGVVAGAFAGLFIGAIAGNWLGTSERWAPARWP